MFCLIVIQLILNLLTITAIDPELELCEDLTIDSAVMADDGQGYAFKGDFFWKVGASDGFSSGEAEYISYRWPGLTGPIDAAFIIDDGRYRLVTVFIKDNKWILYKLDKFIASGAIDSWSYIFKPPVMSGFAYRYNTTLLLKDTPIYLLYDENQYIHYIIHDINNPTFINKGTAYMKGRFLRWLTVPTDDIPGTTLSDFIIPHAVLTDNKNITIFGNRMYCIGDITLDPPAPLCYDVREESDVNEFFKCPRSPFQTTRPTSTTTTTTTTTTTKRTTTTTTRAPPLPPKITRVTTAKTDVVSNVVVTTHKVIASTHNTQRTTRKRFTIPLFTFRTPPEIEVITDPNDWKIPSDGITPEDGGQDTGEPREEGSTEEPKTKKKNYWIVMIVIIVIICVVLFLMIICCFCCREKSSTKAAPYVEDKEKVGAVDTSPEPLIATQVVPQTDTNLDNTNQELKTEPGAESTALYADDNQTTDSLSMASLRSGITDSDESLGTSLKDSTNNPLRGPSDENIKLNEDQTSNEEADQLLNYLKTKENTD